MIDVKKFNRRVMLSLIGFVALGLALPALAAACGSDPDPEVQTRPDAEVQDPPDAGVQARGYIDTIAPIFENARAGSRAWGGSRSVGSRSFRTAVKTGRAHRERPGHGLPRAGAAGPRAGPSRWPR